MLSDLRKYENLGTPSYYFQLLTSISNSFEAGWKSDDVNQIFYNKVVDGRMIFDGCISLALRIKVLISREDFLFVDEKISVSLASEMQMRDKFVEYLLKELVDDDEFHQIFNSKHLTYDVIYKSVQISNNAFGFKFSNFKQLLLDFDVIRHHPVPEIKSFILNSRYKKTFDKIALPEIKKRKIGIEELRRNIEEQQVHGEEAEKFVLSFEKRRLGEAKPVEWIAEYVANEGYDIASFDAETDSDDEYNRFIEVKSYVGSKPYFYWSRNEYLVARRRQNKYWLYLVDRNEINTNGYVPIMIQNPYDIVFNSDRWIEQVEKYKFEWSEQ